MKLVMKKRVNTGYKFDPFKDGITQSILSAWLICREKSRMNTLLGLTSGGASWPLTYGSIAHGALEPYYADLSLGKLGTSFAHYARTALKVYMAGEGKDSLERQSMAEEAAAIVTVILPHYHQKWSSHDTKVRWTAIEKQFKREACGGRCTATGKIDGGFETKKEHWLFETKNKSSFNASYESWLGIDLQLGYYLLGYRSLVGCIPVGALYNILRRPDRLKAKSVSFKDYLEKIDEDVTKRPEHYFMRYRLKFTAKEIQQHELSIEDKLREFMNWHDTTDHKERDLMYNPNACEQFGSTCPYMASCAHGDKSGLTQRTVVHPELV